ncbi:hypothetical protein ACF0H5_018047 [Mactra antiquata]
MTPCTVLILLIYFVQYSVTDGRLDGIDTDDGLVNISGVRLDDQQSKQFGLLMVEVDNYWTPICDDKFTQTTAVVACRQLKYEDGQYLRGAVFESTTNNITPIEFDCTGLESHLNECLSFVHHNCSSHTFVTLYCSSEFITEKANFDIRINNADHDGYNNKVYGAIEINKYGFWGPVCYKNWSNFEANTACKHLGYRGGVVHYATLPTYEPMVLGQFKCRQRDTMLHNCDYVGFRHDIGCSYTTLDNTKQQVAGVLCYHDEEGIQFRLSNQWYGEVQVLYNGSWGSVCSNNWSEYNSKTICNQLGYRNGQTDYDMYTTKGPAYMDNVTCTGNEDSILLCDYTPGWVSSSKKCSSAYVTCEKTVCGSIDIRKEEEMHLMKFCNIVEGNLTVALIETVSVEDYRYYANPGLIEITDYLLLFRVYQLRSIEILFPNLVVIRGDKLFTDYYALYVFEMPDLVDLGLKSLTTISRGSVRLEKNPSLCYVETIDWDAIVVDSADNYFKDNKVERECWNKCSSNCVTTLVVNNYVPRCWNENSCQKIVSCPERCPTGVCNGDTCCHDNCLAGCTGTTVQQCTACRYVSYQDNSGVISCTELCPSGTYMFRNRRCLLENECRDIAGSSRNYKPSKRVQEDLKLVTITVDNNVKQGLCVAHCPDGYLTNPNDSSTCAPCPGKCPKVTKGLKVIDSDLAAKVLKGYNIIEGDLEIKLMYGDKISKILEENLADLEEVTGYIKIQYCYAILSLHFLKNLRRIGGKNLYDGYVFYVLNNANLQELFLDEVTERLYLGPGDVFFHSNRKLCYNKISQFLTTVGRNVNAISKNDVSMETNGDLIPCEIQELTLSSLSILKEGVMIRWSQMTNITDERRFLKYIIYWRETSGEPLSTFEGRDACSDDIWNSRGADADEDSNFVRDIIGGLKPFTNYAMYVKALTVATSKQGAMSNILYFRTNADSPSSPVNLQIQSDIPGELRVMWDSPLKLNGDENTVYLVQWQYKQLDKDIIKTRDYCLNPITAKLFRTSTVIDKSKEDNLTEEEDEEEKKCCCEESVTDLLSEETERMHAIDFHDYLQNVLYTKTSTTFSVKSPIDVIPVSQVLNLSSINIQDENKPSNIPDTSAEESSKDDENKVIVGITSPALEKSGNDFELVTDREWTIKDLGYFTHINIEVKACNKDSENASMLLCSPEAFIFGRTLPNEMADVINASLVTWRLATNKTGSVFVKWEEPTHPNGLILAYDIQVKNPNIVAKPMLICITAKMYRQRGKHGLELEKLSPGNYTLKIRAISLAGNGSWSEEIFFQIPDQLRHEKDINTLIIVLICVAVTIILITTLGIWCFFKKRRVKEELMFSTNPDYMQSYDVYTPDEWEIDRDKVFIVKELGHGSFGMVYEGYLWDNIDKKSEGRKVPVAIKTTNENSSDHDRYQFLQEASIMKKFCCHHVVRLIGVASKEQPAYVLMELMPNGDLKSFLRLHRPDNEENAGRQPPTLRQFLQMAAEIADGMAYLADNKFVHRDLAARNCMVGEDLTVKIGDFGMTRDIYETDYYRKGSRGLLPVRWMPPESLRDGVFTSMTDVWSYGVVLWEMATLAEQPYQGLSNEEVMTYVLSGRIIDSPEGCPIRLYDLMVKCWRFRPKQRPTFKEIIELLLPDLNKKFEEVSYFFSEEARNMEASHSNILENPIPNIIDDFDDNDDGYFDSPVNDYMEEVLPMLCDDEANGAVDSGVISQTNGLNQTHNRDPDVFYPNIMYNQTDFDNNDRVQSTMEKPYDNEVKYPYNEGDETCVHGDMDTADNYVPSLKETCLVNGHVPSDVRTTVC